MRLETTLILAFLADQTSKAAALIWLQPGVPLPVFSGFSLTLGFNTGASFGLFSERMANAPLAMAAFTGILTAMFWLFVLKGKTAMERHGFALIVGGAIGNIIDRLRQGAVTDFLDFSWKTSHWPAFNLADVAITCGAALVLCATILRPRISTVRH